MGHLSFHLVFYGLICILVYSQWYLFRKAKNFVHGRRWPPRIKRSAMFALGGFFALMLVPYLYRLSLGRPPAIHSAWFTYGILYPFGIWSLGSFLTFLCLLPMTRIRPLLAACSGRFSRLRASKKEPDPKETVFNRRAFLRWALGGTTAAPLLLTTYGTVYARTAFETVAIDMPVRDFPGPLAGFRIVQITDLHVGPFTSERQTVKIVTKANALAPDLVVITGDLVHSSQDYIPPCVRALSRLRARYGVFACQGNHEYWVGAEEVRRAVEAAGIRMLVNEGLTLPVRRGRINLAAVDDTRVGAPDLNRALTDLDPSAPTLLLSHRPEMFPYAARRGVDLTLSGHYHGGQIKVRILGVPFTPVRLFTRYVEGAFRIGHSRLYVSRGLGTTGTPVRLGSRPELTLIRLVPG
ncbi:MAG: metallophosphoesterase [Nitrospinota bacterium]